MAALGSLDELDRYLRLVMPQWKAVQNLKQNQSFGFIEFKWNGHHFAVKPTLECFEIKDSKLYITGGSILLNSALLTRTGNERRISAVVEVLDKAEDMVVGRTTEALALIASARKAIQNMVGSSRK